MTPLSIHPFNLLTLLTISFLSLTTVYRAYASVLDILRELVAALWKIGARILREIIWGLKFIGGAYLVITVGTLLIFWVTKQIGLFPQEQFLPWEEWLYEAHNAKLVYSVYQNAYGIQDTLLEYSSRALELVNRTVAIGQILFG